MKSAPQIKGCASHPSLFSSTTIITTFVAFYLEHIQFEIYLRAFRGLLVTTEGYTQSYLCIYQITFKSVGIALSFLNTHIQRGTFVARQSTTRSI